MIKLNRVEKEVLALLKVQHLSVPDLSLSALEIKNKIGERRFRHVSLLKLEQAKLIMCTNRGWRLTSAGVKLLEESEETQKT